MLCLPPSSRQGDSYSSRQRETPRAERLLAMRDSSQRETPRERLLATRETPRNERLLAMRDSSQQATPSRRERLLATRERRDRRHSHLPSLPSPCLPPSARRGDSSRRETPRAKRLLAMRDSSQRETPHERLLSHLPPLPSPPSRFDCCVSRPPRDKETPTPRANERLLAPRDSLR